MSREELGNVDRVAGEYAEHEEPIDDQQIRIGRHVVDGKEQNEAEDQGPDVVERHGRPPPDHIGDKAKTRIPKDPANAPQHHVAADDRGNRGTLDALLLQHQVLNRRQPDHRRPDRQQCAKREQQADEGVEAQLPVEQLQRYEAQEFPILGGGGAGLGGERAAPVAHRPEMLGLNHAAADQQQQQGRSDAGEKHIAPAIAADQCVDLAADNAPHGSAGHHDTENLGAMDFGEGLGHQRDADDDFGPGADPGEEAIDPELQRRLREALQPGEDAVDQDAERQSSYAPDIIGDDAEHEASERPAEQSDGTEDPADASDLGDRRLSAQELGQRRAQYERKQTIIGDRKSTRLNSSHDQISYAVFCLKKKK